MAWKDTAATKAIVLDLMIKEMVQNEDRIPTQLVEPVSNISMVLSDIESLKASNHKANLKPLVYQASGLIIVLWRLYLEDRYPRRLWPPPPLSRTVDKFAKTVDEIRKLLARKCEKSFLKKKIYAVLDLGKVGKYLCKLDAAATKIEGNSTYPRHHDDVVDVNAVLLKAINKYIRENPQDEEAQLLELGVEDAIQEPVVEGSRQQLEEVEVVEQSSSSLSLAEIAGQKSEASEEDETSTRASGETSQSSQSSPYSDSSPSNNTGSVDADHEAETSTRASRDTPESQSSESSPPSEQHEMSNTFNNTGSGVMFNRNTGNIFNTTISNVGNNNSVNHYRR